MSLFQQRIEGYLCHCLLAGYNISLCWHVLSKKPSSQLGYWATALPCTLHFLPFSRLFWINVTLQCTDSFQSSLELFNCLWGFPSKLFFLWCKIENKSFCQIWRTLLVLLNFLSFFVTKRVRRVKKRSILWVSFVQSVVLFPFGSKLYWHLPTHQNTFCMSKAVWVSEEVRFSSRVFSHSLIQADWNSLIRIMATVGSRFWWSCCRHWQPRSGPAAYDRNARWKPLFCFHKVFEGWGPPIIFAPFSCERAAQSAELA